MSETDLNAENPRMVLTGITFDCPDPSALARFYEDLLGWTRRTDESEWVQISPPSGGPGLSFQQEKSYLPPRWPAGEGDQQMQIHLDIRVHDLREAGDRAAGLGAVRADFQPQPDVLVYLDPVGHPFCLYL